MEEKKLVRLSKEGNQEAFAALVKKYKTKVFNLAFSLTHNRETADDMAQETFIKAYFSLSAFKSKSEFGTWLYRITVNNIMDFMRKEYRIKKVSFREDIENPFVQENEMRIKEKKIIEERRRKFVHEAIQTLPEKQQVILSLRDIQGFSYEEISKILNISPGTVDSRIHRARKKLRKKLVPFLSQKGGSHEM